MFAKQVKHQNENFMVFQDDPLSDSYHQPTLKSIMHCKNIFVQNSYCDTSLGDNIYGNNPSFHVYFFQGHVSERSTDTHRANMGL